MSGLTTLGLADHEDADMNTPSGNKSEWLRFLLGMALAGGVAYFTADSAMKARISVMEEREQNHYSEVLRRLDRIEIKVDRGNQ